jgi:large subunit ribosomal protein L22
MTGPKLNEANRVAGTRSGTRASARYVRSSASKVRVVLNLIRNTDVRRADEILQFTDREAARLVRKVLASAVANAVNNDELDADDLYVKACFADEGPTLKRFRPRAKGRAGRINKRTAHITVIVDVMPDAMKEVRDAKSMAKGTATPNRRARVAASRKPANDTPANNEEPVTENNDTVDTATTEEGEN